MINIVHSFLSFMFKTIPKYMYLAQNMHSNLYVLFDIHIKISITCLLCIDKPMDYFHCILVVFVLFVIFIESVKDQTCALLQSS